MADAELRTLLELHGGMLKEMAQRLSGVIERGSARARATSSKRVWIGNQAVRGAGSVGIDLK